MNINEFMKTNLYEDFKTNNPGFGNLKIRAYAASEALPVSGLKVIVSTTFNDQKVIFFEGTTDASGMIETLKLPAPKININNLEIPVTTKYEIDAYFDNELNKKVYYVNMYNGICVVQNINYTPGVDYGS